MNRQKIVLGRLSTKWLLQDIAALDSETRDLTGKTNRGMKELSEAISVSAACSIILEQSGHTQNTNAAAVLAKKNVSLPVSLQKALAEIVAKHAVPASFPSRPEQAREPNVRISRKRSLAEPAGTPPPCPRAPVGKRGKR